MQFVLQLQLHVAVACCCCCYCTLALTWPTATVLAVLSTAFGSDNALIFSDKQISLPQRKKNKALPRKLRQFVTGLGYLLLATVARLKLELELLASWQLSAGQGLSFCQCYSVWSQLTKSNQVLFSGKSSKRKLDIKLKNDEILFSFDTSKIFFSFLATFGHLEKGYSGIM